MKLFLPSALFVLAWMSACTPEGDHSPDQTREAMAVKTAPVVLAPREATRWLPGTIGAVEQATIAAQITGRVVAADFEVGTAIERGQVLVRLAAPEMDARVHQAEVALAQAERDFAREQGLLEKNAATAESVKALDDARKLAEARLVEARAMQAHSTASAPFAGVISRKSVRSGDLAMPGTSLFSVEGDQMEIRVAVPGSLRPPSLGSSLKVIADSVETTAELVALSAGANARTRTREAVLRIAPDKALTSGAFARVGWSDGPIEGIWIDASALRLHGQMEQVFAVKDGVARMRLVKTGTHSEGLVQIHAGLQKGESVVLAPPSGLLDGQPVEEQP